MFFKSEEMIYRVVVLVKKFGGAGVPALHIIGETENLSREML